MLEDFHEQNCVYLELRTTPKNIGSVSKREYLDIIVDEITKFEGRMVAKLLISVNRSQSVEEAWENLNLARSYSVCVGLDFSGNPAVGKFRDFIEVFEKARELGIKTTVHTAEIEDDEDTLDILNFKPDRLGHCVFLTEDLERVVIEQKMPMEVCFSSNLAAGDFTEMTQHHFGKFHARDHPICICTDDTLLFDTDLTKELQTVVDAYQLEMKDVSQIMENSARMAFTPNVISLLTPSNL